jgi:hypothetical protein
LHPNAVLFKGFDDLRDGWLCFHWNGRLSDWRRWLLDYIWHKIFSSTKKREEVVASPRDPVTLFG